VYTQIKLFSAPSGRVQATQRVRLVRPAILQFAQVRMPPRLDFDWPMTCCIDTKTRLDLTAFDMRLRRRNC